MKTLRIALMACTLMATVASAENGGATDATKHFVGCPVYRDTDAGRKSGCWLVTDPASGQQYDVTDARLKPILGQQILVEGVLTSSGSELCGAPILKPVDVSVLPQTCKAHLIPAEGYPGRRFDLPARTMQPTDVPRTLPPPPYERREFTINFELNSDFLVYQYAEMIIEDASLYANASKAQRVLITGYAATRPVEVSGQKISEPIQIAEARARMIAEALARFGVPRERMELRWFDAPADQTTAPLHEASKRRAVIVVEGDGG